MNEQAGKILIVCGIILLMVGVIVYFLGGKLGFLGHLPGDIRIEKGNVKIYIPIATMLLVSTLLTLIFHLIRKFF